MTTERSPVSLVTSDVRSSQFHIRASRFLQKLSRLTRQKKNGQNRDPYQFDSRNTNSLDATTKPYMSQPALGLQTSVSLRDNDDSSRSVSPYPPSPTSRQNHTFSGIIDLGSRDDLTHGTSPDTSVVSNPSTTISLAATAAPTPRGQTLQPHSLPSGRSISFDIPRGPPTSRSTGNNVNEPSKPASKRRSFDFRHAILNKKTEDGSPNSFLSTSLSWTRSALKPPSNVQANEQLSVPNPSKVPRIEGLPASGLGGTDSRWWKVPFRPRENGEQLTGMPPAANEDRAVASPSPSEPLHASSHTSPVPTTPPTYDQAATTPPDPTDPPSGASLKGASLRLSSLPSSAFQIRTDGGSARLSPSVISRHPPLPLASLPTLQIPEVREPVSASRTRVVLRNVPALPMQGADEHELDQENGNSDDEDEFVDADEEPRTPTSPGSEFEEDITNSEADSHVNIAGPSSYTDVAAPPSSLTVYLTPGDATPTHWSETDYFLSRPSHPKQSASLTPSIEWDTRCTRNLALLSPSGSSRHDLPMNHRASKSMVDLLSVKKHGMPTINEEPKGKGKAKDTAPTETLRHRITVADLGSHSSRLKRRRSLPTYTESSEPPPYPAFGKPRSLYSIQPREEEGTEKLPPYSNSIYLSAILPRKVEFTSPGVQSKDRKWRRSLCILEGTAFRVFHVPHGAAGVSALGEWWERKVGVGDVSYSIPPPSAALKRPPRPRKDEEVPEEPTPPTISIAHESSDTLVTKKMRRMTPNFLSRTSNTNGTSSRRRSIDVLPEDRGPRGRRSLSIPRPSLSTSNSNTTSFATSHSTSMSPDLDVPRPRILSSGSDRLSVDIASLDPKDLIRVYTLQQAESGLASDYTKRKNVIRVRMEGEQFLLQAPDIPAVVRWIEGFQAASGIALDIEERPMPKGPVFPRRRRRRARPSDTSHPASPS